MTQRACMMVFGEGTRLVFCPAVTTSSNFHFSVSKVPSSLPCIANLSPKDLILPPKKADMAYKELWGCQTISVEAHFKKKTTMDALGEPEQGGNVVVKFKPTYRLEPLEERKYVSTQPSLPFLLQERMTPFVKITTSKHLPHPIQSSTTVC